jgi:catechol 2,3-dioxygenase-like lactoylglutathione lyase family enzyme
MYRGGLLTIMVSDFNRAVQFYTETLGLQLKARYGDEWAEVQAPGLAIGLHPGRRGGAGSGGGELSIGLEVEDLEAAMATLEARGVQFQGIRGDGAFCLAHFADPDGTALYLNTPHHA